MRILVTGAAGFIGFHAASRLLSRGDDVVGLDNLSSYYDVRLKRDRLAQLDDQSRFSFHELDLGDQAALNRLFSQVQPQRVVHLAAQAGVRYHRHPELYVESNLVGFLHLPKLPPPQYRASGLCSSSSVYAECWCRSRSTTTSPSDQPLRASKKPTTDGSQKPSCTGPPRPRFYGLWPLGSARHGVAPICRCHSGGQAHSGV